MNQTSFILPQSSQLEKRRLFIETLINETTKVTKVSENSVLSGVASGISRLSGLIEKDITVYYSKLHPDYTYGSDLDVLSNLFGLPGRLGSSSSSTYLLIKAEPGTVYNPSQNHFISESGLIFELPESITIGQSGFLFAQVNSQSTGLETNVDPYSINRMNNEPIGHINCLNEVGAIGGRDVEQDELFRRRLKEGVNVLATNTLSMLEQRCIQINNNILKVIHQGLTDQGKILIKVLTQNGRFLNSTELEQLTQESSQYLALTDHRFFNKNNYSIEFRNADFFPIDMEVRCDFDGTDSYDNCRINMQILVMRYLDWREWNSQTQVIEWDNLLEMCKSTKGIRYIQDQTFIPRKDIIVPHNMFPRLRGFKLTDLSGQLVSEDYGDLINVFYQNEILTNYQEGIL